VTRLETAARLAALALPVAMLHSRAVAEVLMAAIILLFLLQSLLLRKGAWLASGWLRIGLAWWGWLILCSLPAWPGRTADSLPQALAAGRYLLLVAALQHFVLRPLPARRAMLVVLDLLSLYIGAHLLAQAVLGRSLYGQPRWDQGELTGPFDRPRAAMPLSRLLLPVLLRRLPGWPFWASAVLSTIAIATVALAGQRMPLVLLLFGLLVGGFLLPRLRWRLFFVLVAGALAIGLAAALSPPVAARFALLLAQLVDFPATAYGRIAAHALRLLADHPWIGLGARGFRHVCAASHSLGCAPHPHNHYLEAATDAGLPGLVLFVALVLAWLRALGRGLLVQPDALRAGLFAAVLIQEWPISSMSNFGAIEFAVPFVLLGLGLAEADVASAKSAPP
jgi:O-antigen ligase